MNLNIIILIFIIFIFIMGEVFFRGGGEVFFRGFRVKKCNFRVSALHKFTFDISTKNKGGGYRGRDVC